jgi:5-methylcytosine-specific restriction enzyme subunit McrC
MMLTIGEHITLKEQSSLPVVLGLGDVRFLQRLHFEVALAEAVTADDGDASIACFVNPTSCVGHFELPSGRIIIVEPKIDAASVFRMLGYVFSDEHRKLFERPDVQYASERLLFEPLVERFSALVTARTKKGLLQDYIRHEENLGVFRGALNIEAHVQENLGRENRVHCRFFEQTVDVSDNRYVKATLWHLIQFGGWTPRTAQSLIRNLHHFDGVTLEPLRPQGLPNRHYHRLNDDYRPIHELCRLFAECSSVSEHFGSIRLNGFLLDMNRLFEEFVETAFLNASQHSDRRVTRQGSTQLSLSTGAPKIKPDVTVWSADRVVAIADAKYKGGYATPPNADMYQVIAYGTVLDCPEVYLLYPQTEIEAERDFPVLNSPIVVKTRQLDISSSNAVACAEALAGSILASGEPIVAVGAA